MEIKEILKKRMPSIVLASAISGTALVTNVTTVKAENVENIDEGIISEESDNQHTLVESTLTETQLVVKEAVFSMPESKATVVEKSMESGEFDTREEAQDWIDTRTDILEEVYDITKEEIKEITTVKQDGEPVKVEEEFTSEKEALDKKNELESDLNKECNLEITSKEEHVSTDVKVEFDQTFGTKEEVDEYKETLEDKNDLEIQEKVVTEEKVYEEEKVIDITKDDEEELDKEIKNIIDSIKSEETDKISYDTRVEKDSKEETIEGEVSKEEINASFESKKEAEDFINGKLEESTNDITFEFGEITERVEKNKQESDIDEVVDSKDAVDLFIENLKQEGYEVSDLVILDESIVETEKVATGDVVVNNSTKFESSSYFECEGNYAIIKQGKGTAVVWTLDELTESEQLSFKVSYLESGFDPSIKDSNFQFISGTGLHDLSYIDKNWGTYNVNYEDNKIIVECDKDRISHLNVGTVDKIMEEIENVIPIYRVTGKKTMVLEETLYDVSGVKQERLYEQIMRYFASIFKTKKEIIEKYNISGSYVDKEVEIFKKYVLSGEIINYITETKYKGLIEYRLDIPEYKPEEKPENKPQHKPENKPVDNTKEDIDALSPKTGDDSNIGLYSQMLLASSTGLGLCAAYAYQKGKVKKLSDKR